jgi:5-methylcytosine-specific restriction endonuclease McrA
LAKPEKRGPKPRKPIRRTKRPAHFRIRGGTGKMKKLADDAMSLFVRCRDNWTCGKCGTTMMIQNAHIIAKGPYPAGRYEDRNTIALCQGCHRYFTARFPEWRKWIGPERHDGLASLYVGTVAKWDYAEEARRFLLLTATRYPQVGERLASLNKRAEALGLWK